jgi:hypothetical protein
MVGKIIDWGRMETRNMVVKISILSGDFMTIRSTLKGLDFTILVTFLLKDLRSNLESLILTTLTINQNFSEQTFGFTSYRSLTWSRNNFSASPWPKSGFRARPCGSFSSFGLDSVHDTYSTKVKLLNRAMHSYQLINMK